MNAAELKAKEQKGWTTVAPGWRTHDAFLMRASAPVTARMLELADVGPGKHVLDIACGTGEPAIPAARRVGPSGRVIATDFVEDMLAFAREKAVRAGVRNVEFRQADGEALDFPEASFDAVTSRFGIMFMPEPATCLSAAHRVLRPGGHIVVATWGPPEKNTWASIPAGVLRKVANAAPPPPGAPGIFAFADDTRLRGTLEGAGFADVKIEPVEVDMADHDTPAAYFTFLREIGGPIAVAWAQLTPAQQAEATAEIFEQITGTDGRVEMTGVAWVAAGRK